jgi:hypothetical protein
MTLIAGLALINAAGVASELVAAHVGDRGAAQSAIETQDAALAARIDVQAHTVADIDRRLGQIDSAIEEAAKRGRTNTALSAIEGQKKAHERWRALSDPSLAAPSLRWRCSSGRSPERISNVEASRCWDR